jgi:hypothetical protein
MRFCNEPDRALTGATVHDLQGAAKREYSMPTTTATLKIIVAIPAISMMETGLG